MIPNNVKQAEVQSTFGGTHVAMTINMDAMPYLMEMLTNLYSDEELACIREYSTNAWDAHFDAGTQHRPIEVNTPSPLSPYLSIKDYGVGLDRDLIVNLYSQYGASTKREQRETNGSMGVGAKSALAYTTQFTVVGIKDGTRTTVVVSRDENGVGDMQIIDESVTDEPNGVEILIPAKDRHSFEEKAKNFFQFWPEGSVLLNGAEPERNLHQLSDRIFFWDGDHDVVVMGNVAYPVNNYHAISRNVNRRVACFVTMNGDDEVVFTPSREALNYNAITTNALAGLREEFDEATRKFIEESIESTETRKDALDMYAEMKQIFGNRVGNHFTWHGEDVVLTDEVKYPFTNSDGETFSRHKSATAFHPNRNRYAVDNISRITIDYLRTTQIIITGFTKDSLSSAYKGRIRNYISGKGLRVGGYYGAVVLVSDSSFDGFPWHNAAMEGKTHKWEDILAATKPPKRERQAPVERDGAYDVLVKGAYSYDEMDLEPDDNIIYYTIADYGRYGIDGAYAKVVFDVEPDAKIVCVGANRIAKLKRLHSNVREFNITYWNTKRGENVFAALTEEQIETMRVNYEYKQIHSYYHNYSGFGIDVRPSQEILDNLLDREYAGIIEAYHRTAGVDTGALEYSAEFKEMRALWSTTNAVRWDEKYPLIKWDDNPEETLEYVNWMYTKNQENDNE